LTRRRVATWAVLLFARWRRWRDRGAVSGRAPDGPAGQGLVEYGLILAVVAVACVISLVFFGDQLSYLLSLIASAV
jgi:Flp pilus assembly pilin Flp